MPRRIESHSHARQSILSCQSTSHELRHSNARREGPASASTAGCLAMDAGTDGAPNLCEGRWYSVASSSHSECGSGDSSWDRELFGAAESVVWRGTEPRCWNYHVFSR